ncbi:PIN domain-containing protein [Promicromonospora soli]
MADAQYVLLDTDVWSMVYVRAARKRDDRAVSWTTQLQGMTVVISTQSRAEVLSGLATSDFGERRREAIVAQLNATPTVPVTEDVVVAYADLTGDCRRAGHALQQKQHTGDRWVAATAIATGIPLLAGDAIYEGAPGVPIFGADQAPVQEVLLDE